MDKKKKIPALRFPGFEGEWEEKKLGNISKIERGRFSPRPRNNPIYYGGKIPFVQTGDVVKSKGRIINYSQTLNEKGLKVSKMFTKGTILITIAANIGCAGVLEIDMACPDSLVGISCHKPIYNRFLNCIFEIEQPRMDYLAIEAAQKNINIEFLKIYPIISPSLPEQQKIADFLTAVDDKINRLTRKKTLLEQYKKGVMQKIFSQEIRFPEFEGEWEVKKLGEVGFFYYGKSAPKHSISKDAKTPCVRYGELYTKFNGVIEKIHSYTATPEKNLKFSQGGEILIPRVGEDPMDFCKCSWLPRKGVAIGEMISVYNTNQHQPFIVAYIRAKLRHQFARFVEGGSVSNLYFRYLEKVKIPLPTLPEQQKIADFLTGIDKKIELVNTQLEKTKEWKKGLLQQMFV